MKNHHHHHEYDAADLAELVDLDAEVLHAYHSGVIALIPDDQPIHRIVDIGAGTGTGALALARRFPAADVTALDASESMLRRLTEKAGDLGVADRVHTVQADLDAGWPVDGAVDLVWASNSLHHMADPARVLADVFGALRPGGLLVVAELNSFPYFLPDTDGFEARCHAAVNGEMADELPHLGSDWATRLTEAGFVIEVSRIFEIELAAPLPEAAGRYARLSFVRLRSRAHLSTGDLARLDALIDGPDSVLRRDDLVIRATRSVWVARRP